MEIMVIIVGWCVCVAAFVVYELVWLVRDIFVKHPRRVKWCEAHDGLIGDESFLEWCRENGVNPNYYI